MLTLSATDAGLITRAKRFAFIAWLAALSLGLLSWGARVLDFHGLASALMLAVWVAGAAFVVCWLFLAVSALILVFNHLSGRSGGA
ncbi:hypothetical protein [Lysobacter sp. Root494]|uniref:hypothetical protein n=1 Tax=Lysobacter sp. Root494 TaxID=1736549 RepID=UPI0006F29F0F|nr:hypothetical protein [Lysobacter sp. Root494]KQY51922.1 hypothetical protein ASD14_04415 [Lysobacter sp. Root494]